MRAVVFGALVGAAVAEDGPVAKIVSLLNDMKKETEANQKKDEETFGKLECWCKKTLKETAEGLQAAADCIEQQQTKAESAAGTNAEKSTQAEHLKADIEELERQIAESIAQREKEANEFGEQEKDLIQSIGALKSAITVLSKHHKGFLQESAHTEIRDKYGRYISKYEDKLSPSQRRAMQQFLQQPSSAAYQSQSGEIFGILQSMLDEMSADQSDAAKEEAAAQEAYAKMKANKTNIVKEKTKLMQDALETAGDAGKDAEDAKDQLAACQAEQESLENLKASAEQQCEAGKEDFQARSKAVATELKAIDKAIEILDSEDAFAAFQKSTDAPAGFLQRSLAKMTRAKSVSKVISLLQKNAGDDFFGSNYGLGKAARAVAMMLQQKNIEGQTDMFARIQNAVKEQIKAKEDLLAAKSQEKDTCNADIKTSDENLLKLDNVIEGTNAKIEDLTGQIEALTTQLKENNEEVASITESIKNISQERSEANAAYMKEMEENKAAVQLIEQAKSVLAEVYGSKSFIQQAPQFDRYEKNAGGNVVLQMMTEIVNKTKQEMAVAMESENHAQKAYETQIKNSNDAIKALKSGIAKAEKTKADKNGDKAEAEATLKNKTNERTDEQTNNDQLHKACDFLLKHYDDIVKAHREEIDGLTEAQTILANVISDLTK